LGVGLGVEGAYLPRTCASSPLFQHPGRSPVLAAGRLCGRPAVAVAVGQPL